MKNSINVFILIGILLGFAQCKDMDETYKDYLVPNGIVYPGRAANAVIYSGNERVMIVWPKGTDPAVVKARIFWNNYTDFIEVDLTSNVDTFKQIIAPLQEASYSFMIRTYDAAGNASIPVELNGTAYGEMYENSLLNRPVVLDLVRNDTLTIQWGAPDLAGGAKRTEVTYENLSNNLVSLQIPTNVSSTVINDYKPGTLYKYRTMYIPDSLCIDTFYSAFEERTPGSLLDKTGWTATADCFEDDQQLSNHNSGPPDRTIDGDLWSYWHTDHSPNPWPPYPHWLAYDLTRKVNVALIELTSRQDGDSYRTSFRDFTIQGSNDGVTWNDYGNFVHPETKMTQSYAPDKRLSVRYIRIYMKTGPERYSHMSEFSIYGTLAN